MIRIIGAVMTVAGCFLFARYKTYSIRKTASTSLALSNDLQTLSSLIGFTRPDLHTALTSLSAQSVTGVFWKICAEKIETNGVSHAFAEALAQTSDKLYLSANTKTSLLYMSRQLGISDISATQQLILRCRKLILTEYEQLSSELEKSAGLKQRIALLCGLLIAVVLI